MKSDKKIPVVTFGRLSNYDHFYGFRIKDIVASWEYSSKSSCKRAIKNLMKYLNVTEYTLEERKNGE